MKEERKRKLIIEIEGRKGRDRGLKERRKELKKQNRRMEGIKERRKKEGQKKGKRQENNGGRIEGKEEIVKETNKE